MKASKLWVAVLCVFAAVVILQARGDVDHVPPSLPLALFPARLDHWSSEDLPISAESLEILGKGVFLNRLYTPPASPAGQAAAAAPVQLFIAYFPTQRSGQSIHSPQNCLPGSGWTFARSGVTEFTDRTGKEYRVGDYLISNGKDRQEVLYWYQSHGRSIASDYRAKLDMLTDAIRTGRTDAALVRIITPLAAGESPDAARNRVVTFAKDVTPLLPDYVPN